MRTPRDIEAYIGFLLKAGVVIFVAPYMIAIMVGYALLKALRTFFSEIRHQFCQYAPDIVGFFSRYSSRRPWRKAPYK